MIFSLLVLVGVDGFALTEYQKSHSRDLGLHPSMTGVLSPNMQRVYNVVVEGYANNQSGYFGIHLDTHYNPVTPV